MKKPQENGRTVLLVDDEWLILGAMREILGAQGYNILTAGDPSEALRICQQYEGTIDVMLTDVVMPGMNGRELADRVTEMRPETRVIFMSGHTEDNLVRHGVMTNEIAFVRKPFSLAALEGKVQEVLGDGGPSGARRASIAAAVAIA
jgi:YesN/AraC family two-component response regulator